MITNQYLWTGFYWFDAGQMAWQKMMRSTPADGGITGTGPSGPERHEVTNNSMTEF